jgi:hypothetical protein
MSIAEELLTGQWRMILRVKPNVHVAIRVTNAAIWANELKRKWSGHRHLVERAVDSEIAVIVLSRATFGLAVKDPIGVADYHGWFLIWTD